MPICDWTGQPGIILRHDVDLSVAMALRLAQVEQAIGDEYLTKRLWASAPDPLPHQLSALLAANGLRVGIISGPLPAEFDALATGATTAIAPTLRRGLAGQPKVIPVNGPFDRLTADVIDTLTGDPRRLSLEAAEFALTALGTLRPSGPMVVKFQWQTQYGDKRAFWTPTADGGFDRTDERPKEGFPALAFEVDLEPADTLVVGPTMNPEGTLGAAFFVTTDGLRQRVLVVRATAGK